MASVQSAGTALKQAAANPLLELLERLGYVVRGALYAVVGLLAFGNALRIGSGQPTDLSGALVVLTGNPYGKVVLIVAAVGLAAYSLWGFVRAIFDPLHRGRDASGYMARLGFVSSAVSYASIVWFALQLLTGSGGTGVDSTPKTIASVLNHPAGGLITVIIGLVAIGVGFGQFVEAYRATFAGDLKGAELSPSEMTFVTRLGRFGMFARGVIFLVIGWFILQAGIHHDPAQVQGLRGRVPVPVGPTVRKSTAGHRRAGIGCPGPPLVRLRAVDPADRQRMTARSTAVRAGAKRATSLLILSSRAGSMTPQIEAKLCKAFAGSLIVEFDPKMVILSR